MSLRKALMTMAVASCAALWSVAGDAAVVDDVQVAPPPPRGGRRTWTDKPRPDHFQCARLTVYDALS